MNYKTTLFLILKGETSEDNISLKQVLQLKSPPVTGMKIKIRKKVHSMVDVIYDFDDDEYIVVLDHDSYITKKVFNGDFKTLTELYIEEGWERLVPFTEEKILNVNLTSAITLIDEAREILSADSFIGVASSTILKLGITSPPAIQIVLSNSKANTQEETLIMREIEKELTCDDT